MSERATNLIIFGFTGDLAKRKLLPALYHLLRDGMLDDHFEIIATTRREVNMDEYRKELENFIHGCDTDNCDNSAIDELLSRVHLLRMDISSPKDFQLLKHALRDQDKDCSVGHTRLYYFAVPPKLFGGVVANMAQAGLHEATDAPSRLLVEKPFGNDYESANQLCRLMGEYFDEESIYRIDHYLAKDTVQNILHLRFDNALFRSAWNSRHIDSIEITSVEDIDIQGRANFYEQTGALRDMIQSHLLQVLALVSMDQPKELSGQVVRDNRLQLLQSIQPVKNARRGQYVGYRDEVKNDSSVVETYAELDLRIANDRWGGGDKYPPTRFTIRAGKAFSEKKTEVVITFRDTAKPDILRIRLQPKEGVSLEIQTRKPGLNSTDTETIDLSYEYTQSEDEKHDAYEKILLDAISGDQTLFPTNGEVLNNWKLIDPILEAWRTTSAGLITYDKGQDFADL